MRVLLISPLPGIDPPCGDVTYSENLLANPPDGVEYVTYAEALADGTLVEHGRRSELKRTRGLARVRAAFRILRERTVNALRRRGVLFAEPFRHFSVRPGAYDVVHCHVFSAAFCDLDAALVMSNAAPIEDLYLGARGWSSWHVAVAARADRWIARRLGVQHTSLRMPRADVVVAFTETLREELVRRGAARPEQTRVAPCFVDRRPRPLPNEPPHRIGFVATAFEAKGGPTVLEAFDEIRRHRPDAVLTIIGSPPRLDVREQEQRGIEWTGRVERSVLMATHVPRFDVFAYPTLADGLPLSVLEVMAMGIPVVTSDLAAMPEVVGYGAAGRVVPRQDASRLAREVLDLLDPAGYPAAVAATQAWFDQHYDTATAVGRLGLAYRHAAELAAVRGR